MKWLVKLRHWLDGDTETQPTEHSVGATQQEFALALLHKIEAVLRQEMLDLPGGSILFPPGCIIFWSQQEENQWQGIKREALDQWLCQAVNTRIQELSNLNVVQYLRQLSRRSRCFRAVNTA